MSKTEDPNSFGSGGGQGRGVRCTNEFPRKPGDPSLLDGFSISDVQVVTETGGQTKYLVRFEPGGFVGVLRLVGAPDGPRT